MALGKMYATFITSWVVFVRYNSGYALVNILIVFFFIALGYFSAFPIDRA